MANGGLVVAEATVPEQHVLRRRLRWPLIILPWLIPGLVQASQSYLLWDSVSFSKALALQLPPWLYWAPVTPAILWLVSRYRLEKRSWPLSLAVHLIANIVFSAIHVVASVLYFREVGGHPFYMNSPLSAVLIKVATKNVHIELMTYWVVVATALAVEYQRRFRERTVTAAQLETRLAQAQLETLKTQLHPHFLFNTLNAISVLVRKQDTQGSIKMITGLSDLLRRALDTVNQQIVPLRQELDFVQRYLAIEKVRFQDRLTVITDVGPEALQARVPNLLLQPLVENAIRHGISARAEPGQIEIRAHRQGDQLVLTVRDDGNGLRDGWRPGVGMSNVRARLLQLYPERHRLELTRDERGGTVTTVAVPFEEEAE